MRTSRWALTVIAALCLGVLGPADAREVPPARQPDTPPTQPGPAGPVPGMNTAVPAPDPAHTHPEPEHVHRLPTNALAQAVKEGYREVSFTQLTNFNAATTADRSGLKFTGQIPNDIQSLNGKRVVVAGFLRPLTVHEGRVTSFNLLAREPECCAGGPPQLNEVVFVRMQQGIQATTTTPVAVGGVLNVGEYRENGRLRALFVMEGEIVRGPDEP